MVNGSEVAQPEAEDANGIMRKWKIKVGREMFALKTTIDEDVLEHFCDAKSPKEAWDLLVVLFSKMNDARLQLLKHKMLSSDQLDLTVSQHFHRVKNICPAI